MRSSPRPLRAVDLFAGCGGLSFGLKQAGFQVVSAVEIDGGAADTYRANMAGTKLLVEDVREVSASNLLAGHESLDLLAGCAPCQGFCSLTSKWDRVDPRNELLLEMARLVEEMQPKTIIMENVPGVLQRGSDIFDEFNRRMSAAGYYGQYAVLQMADYGIPQRRRRLVYLAGRGFAIPLPEPTHARVPTENQLPWTTVRDALRATELGAPTRMSVARRKGPSGMGWHVVRDLQPQTRARLKAALPGGTWKQVDESLRPECHRGDYVGFTNVYGRMAWDQPSPTITSGCTTPAKGRFGHPDRRRTTISVLEAALLQTFPKGYTFASDHIDHVCEMIGNAVPPKFARVLGAAVTKALQAHERALHASQRERDRP